MTVQSKLRLILITIVLSVPIALLAQQGIVVIKARNAATLTDVTSFNALKVALYDSAGSGILASTDPCDGALATTVAISQTSSTKLISQVSAKKNYICGGAIVVGAAEIVNFVEGTGSTCGSSTAALAGSTTAANGMSFAANGGFVITKTISGFTANVDGCLTQSGSNRVSGWITYVQN